MVVLDVIDRSVHLIWPFDVVVVAVNDVRDIDDGSPDLAR